MHHLTPQRVPTSHPFDVAFAHGQLAMPRDSNIPFTALTTDSNSSGWSLGLSVSSQRQNVPAAMAARGQMVALTDLPKFTSCAGEFSKHGASPFRPARY